MSRTRFRVSPYSIKHIVRESQEHSVRDITEFSNLLQPKNQRRILYYFDFERNYDVLKSKSAYFLLSKNKNLNKNNTESKMEDPTQSFRKISLVLQLI